MLARSQLVEKDRVLSAKAKRTPAKFLLGKYTVSADSLGWIFGQVNISFNLIPREALEFLRRKSFTIAAIENQQLRDAIQQKLVDAVEQGKTYREFVEEIKPLFEEGIPFRPDTVFRTNIASAYSLAQLTQAGQMRGRFPMWRYSAIKDDRTRPSHRALDGKLFKNGEGPYPPIDFNCRCTGIFLHFIEVEQLGLEPDVVDLSQINERFLFEEIDRWLQQQLNDLDPTLREALETFLR